MSKTTKTEKSGKKKSIDLLSLLSQAGSVTLEGVYIEKITFRKEPKK